MKSGFVLIPGAGMSDWVWEKLIPLLDRGAITISQRIRDNTYENRMNSCFSDVLIHANSEIDASGFDEVILVGHSGAGLIAGALGKLNDKVKHVVFIAANIPMNRTTAIDVFPKEMQDMSTEAVKHQALNDSIPMKAMEQQFRSFYCNTCTEGEIAFIMRQDYKPEPICVLTEKMDWSNYPSIGKTYIICTQDKTLNENQQMNMAGNLEITDIRHIKSDHMVMISHPEELACELSGILREN